MEKHKYSLITFLLAILCLTSGQAQNSSIEGTVFGDNEKLAFANLLLEPGLKGTTTDENGYFHMDDIVPGKYTVKVSYVGYQSSEQQLELLSTQQLKLDIQLSSSIALGEIVVTGTMKPTYVSESPIKVDVITSRQLETFIPAAASSIVEGIQLVNGVQEVIACGVCYTNSISINGLQGAYTAVLMDGTPMYGNLASVYGLNGIPTMIIDRFEVIKGPSSTLYGSEAVAGVINIITKNPEDQPRLSVDLMGTTHRESFGNIAYAPHLGKTNGYIGVNWAYVNDFDDLNNDSFGDAINLDRISLFSKWNIHRKSGKRFSVSGKYYFEDRRNGVEAFVADRAYRQLRGSDQVYGESIYTNRAELFGTYEFNTKAKLKLDFSLSHHDQDSYYGDDFYKAKQQIAFGNLIWNFGKNKHDFLMGLTSRYNAYDDNSVATEVQGKENTVINKPNNQFIPGVFLQDELKATDNLTFLAGARLDHYASHGFIFSPRLNLKYKTSDWTTLRMNFGTGFRIVNLFTEDHAFVTGQRTVEIVEELLPEKSFNTSLNLNHVYSAFGGAGTIDIESYYTRFSNKIIPDYDIPGKIIYSNSKGFAQTMGLGLNINHSFKIPLSVNAGINLQSAIESEKDANGQNIKNDIEFAPKWSGVFTANYILKKEKMSIAYTANITGHMALPEVYDVDNEGNLMTEARATISKPFSLHNLQISKEFNKVLKIYGGAQNLFNFVQRTSPLIGYNDPNAPIGFSPFFDTSYAYAPNHGREFYLGIKLDLN